MPGVHKFDGVAKREAAAAELIDVYTLIDSATKSYIFHYSIAAQDEYVLANERRSMEIL